MRACRFILGLAVGLGCLVSSASAILIDTGSSKVGGFLVSEDGMKLTIRVTTPDGQEKVTEYASARVKVLHRLDVKRLEELSRDNPGAYRDYADELARQEADPEARYVARRLYLIAAKLDPQQFGSSSLLKMSEQDSVPAEARKYRALAYLLDPKVDDGLLKVEVVKPAQPAKAPAGALRDFMKALQSYRAGQIKTATDIAKRESVEKIFSRAPGMNDRRTFLRWCTDANCATCKAEGKVACAACKGTGTITMFGRRERCPTCGGQRTVVCPDCDGTHVRLPLPDDVLHTVLRAELWAMDQLAGADAGGKEAAEAKGWSSVLQRHQLNPVLPLSLDTITEFDPRKCHYRNGVWVAP